VGSRLVSRLLDSKDFHVTPTQTVPIGKIVLFDINDKSIPQRAKTDERSAVVLGDLTDKATVLAALDPTGFTHVTVIHLAALLSGNSEDNFDLGMKINLFGTINVMECVREVSTQLGSPQIYVYVSTDYVAAFNEYNRAHPVTEESFRLSPVSYGCQKACCELLVCDYTRKGFLDGRVARLSAVIGRPGFSNSISYPYTGIFTQPLEGKDYDVPLPMEVIPSCLPLNDASAHRTTSHRDNVKTSFYSRCLFLLPSSRSFLQPLTQRRSLIPAPASTTTVRACCSWLARLMAPSSSTTVLFSSPPRATPSPRSGRPLRLVFLLVQCSLLLCSLVTRCTPFRLAHGCSSTMGCLGRGAIERGGLPSCTVKPQRVQTLSDSLQKISVHILMTTTLNLLLRSSPQRRESRLARSAASRPLLALLPSRRSTCAHT
jgi:hypothetical protein